MNNQKSSPREAGIAHILLIVIILAALVVLGYFLFTKFGFQLPSITGIQQGPKVSLKSEYKNPFEKETQYVNPFETYKNPFVVNK